MFRNLVFGPPQSAGLATPADRARMLFTSSPQKIIALMNWVWERRTDTTKTGVLKPGSNKKEKAASWEDESTWDHPSWLPGYLKVLGILDASGCSYTPIAYPNALEAFCLENTRIVEIFRRVIAHFVTDEKLGVPTDTAEQIELSAWLRTTETVFFSNLPPLTPFAVNSGIRNDPDRMRRNLYYRLFGADLLHPLQDASATDAARPVAANKDFFPTFERLLAEVWRGIVNAENTSGRKDSDPAAIALLARRIHDMMADRRQGGNLQREEFCATALLSWLHMSVAWDSPIVLAMKAKRVDPSERLMGIGMAVGLKPHVHSAAYFQMAPLAGTVLEMIGSGQFNDDDAAEFFYRPIPGSPHETLHSIIKPLITRYMQATGRDIKAAAVSLSQRT